MCEHDLDRIDHDLILELCIHGLFTTTNHWKCYICNVEFEENIGARHDPEYYSMEDEE